MPVKLYETTPNSKKAKSDERKRIEKLKREYRADLSKSKRTKYCSASLSAHRVLKDIKNCATKRISAMKSSFENLLSQVHHHHNNDYNPNNHNPNYKRDHLFCAIDNRTQDRAQPLSAAKICRLRAKTSTFHSLFLSLTLFFFLSLSSTLPLILFSLTHFLLPSAGLAYRMLFVMPAARALLPLWKGSHCWRLTPGSPRPPVLCHRLPSGERERAVRMIGREGATESKDFTVRMRERESYTQYADEYPSAAVSAEKKKEDEEDH